MIQTKFYILFFFEYSIDIENFNFLIDTVHVL
jgi:hypothetical protein